MLRLMPTNKGWVTKQTLPGCRRRWASGPLFYCSNPYQLDRRVTGAIRLEQGDGRAKVGSAGGVLANQNERGQSRGDRISDRPVATGDGLRDRADRDFGPAQSGLADHGRARARWRHERR